MPTYLTLIPFALFTYLLLRTESKFADLSYKTESISVTKISNHDFLQLHKEFDKLLISHNSVVAAINGEDSSTDTLDEPTSEPIPPEEALAIAQADRRIATRQFDRLQRFVLETPELPNPSDWRSAHQKLKEAIAVLDKCIADLESRTNDA